MILTYVVDNDYIGKTVRDILKNKLSISTKLMQKLKVHNFIYCDKVPVYVNHIVNYGQIIEVNIDFTETIEYIKLENIAIDIIYEDNCMIVINKSPNMVVHPTFTHQEGTVANALAYYFMAHNIQKKIRPVSRLDRDTSGLIIFAKNQYIQENLIRQMATKSFKKEYYGVVFGKVKEYSGTINLPIARHPDSIMLRHISDEGQPSITHYELIESFSNYSLLKFHLETGRTHQIRVHCTALGHPLLGDTLYSDLYCEHIDRQALHSFKVSFIHPINNNLLELYAPIPDDIKNLLEILRK